MKISYRPKGHVRAQWMTFYVWWIGFGGFGLGMNLVRHETVAAIIYGVGLLLCIVGYFGCLHFLEYEYEIGDES